MDNSKYISALEHLQIYDHDHLYEFEQSHIPLQNLFRMRVVKSYKYRGRTIQYYPDKIFIMADLPFTAKYKRGIFTCTLTEAIDKEIIIPFLLFQDGRYMDWDNVKVVVDWSVSYLIIERPYSNSENFSTIIFPYEIIINDAATLYDIDDRTLFMFNEEGYYVNYGRFKTHLKNQFNKNDDTNFGLNADWPTHVDPSLESGGSLVDTGEQGGIWLKTISLAYNGFPDGSYIVDDSIYYRPGDTYIMVSMKYSNPLSTHFTGRYTNWYANLYIDNLDKKYTIGPANFVCFDKDGRFVTNTESVEINEYNEFKMKDIGMYFDMFYYLFNNKSINNSLTVRNSTILDKSSHIDGRYEIKSEIVKLLKPFELKFDKRKSYEDNVLENRDKIYYTPEIISKINDENPPISTWNVKGKDLLKAVKEDGYIHVFRNMRRDRDTENCFIMVFNNGELLRNYYDTKYDDESMMIPTDMIHDEDDIELVFFHHVDNRRFDITIDPNTFRLSELSEDIVKENIELYCRDSHRGFKFNIHNRPSVYIEVGYDVKDGSLYLGNDYYYNRPLVMCSSNQFHHYSFRPNNIGVRIKLPPEFDLCNKKENYIVFINGRKQNDFHFTEMTDTRPFFDKAIYTHKMYERGDIIDVFYLPYKSEIMFLRLDEYGNLSSNDDIYFCKNTSLLFINGKKVPHKQITELPMEGLRILKDYHSLKNVVLFKLKEPEFNDVYYSDLWNAIGSLPNNYKDELLWLPSLGEVPENDMMRISRQMGMSVTDPKEGEAIGAVFANMFKKKEYHRSILMTGKYYNGLEMKIIEHAKNTIDDIESDMCSDELDVTQVLYEIIKDYYVLPNILPDGGIYSEAFYYDYDAAVLDFSKDQLNSNDPTSVYIIRLLTAFEFNKAPQSETIL